MVILAIVFLLSIEDIYVVLLITGYTLVPFASLPLMREAELSLRLKDKHRHRCDFLPMEFVRYSRSEN